MNEHIRAYYSYFMENKDKKILKDVKSYCKKNKIDFSKLTDKVTRNIAKLKFELTGLGYELSLEGFSKLLEDYLAKKSSLSDSLKKRYLRILVNLSKIYDIDLRTELLKNIKNPIVKLNRYNNPTLPIKRNLNCNNFLITKFLIY